MSIKKSCSNSSKFCKKLNNIHYPPSRPAISAKVLLQWAIGKGADISSCLKGTDLSLVTLSQSDSYIESQQELRLIENIFSHLRLNAHDGLEVGLQYSINSYSVWGFAVSSCHDLNSAAILGLKHLHLTYAFTQMKLEVGSVYSHIHIDNDYLPVSVKDFILNRDIGGLLRVQRDLVNSIFPFAKVALSCPAPNDSSVHLKEFGVLPQYKQDKNIFSFSSDVLSLTLPGHSLELNSMCRNECEGLLKKQKNKYSYSLRVRQLLKDSPVAVTMEQAANEFNVTIRTLRRNLESEGTTFRGILNEYRKKKSIELLTFEGVSIQETSFRLGYSHPSNFAHAFKRWYGVNVSQYIKTN
ncbi:AraC family transcriptional regulator ligand-binding domain-containing protein [Pseudomonas protegens]|uniref:AraC family transcriptional regulator n=1 Tax=Pseudomonas protegens TaxID=380021 RepID=UPI00381B7217